MQIERHDTPDPALRIALMAQLDRHNSDRTGWPADGNPYSILLRRPDGTVEGGVVGYVWYSWLVVELIYLPATLRGHDLGTRIMRDLESHAVGHGCTGIWLSTLSFQAPLFYERLGFTRFATLQDRPRGHATMFMAKRNLVRAPIGLTIERRATPADRAVISAGLSAEVDRIAPYTAFPLALSVGEGGLWTMVSRDWMFLDLFVLPEALRGTGIGSAVLREAERTAKELGCVGIWLDTFSFQARPFYEGLGYTVFGQLDDYPAGHTRYFLQKRLDGASSTGQQGG
jgi:GNAT superfamily N-acetyltransferase